MNTKIIVVAAASALAAVYSNAKAQSLTSFSYGDIVVVQGGDAVNTQALDTGTVPAYLDEYTTAGVLVGQIAVPSSASGSNDALTLNNVGATSHEGLLTLSENGQYLTFAGYNQGAGTTAFSSAPSGTIGIIGVNASSLDTSTAVPMGVENVRGATTIDGNEFYVAEAHGATSTTQGGLNYVSGTGATATTTNLGDLLDPRSVQVLGGANASTGVLSAGTGSSSFEVFNYNAGQGGHGVFGITGSGGGLPTTSALSGTQINADATDGSDVVYDNEPGNTNSYHGYNTMYVAGNNSANNGYIEKYSFNGTQFVADGSIVDTAGPSNNPIGITEQLDNQTGNIDVFYTEATGIYELNAPDNSTSGFLSATSTLVASAPTGSAFYGVANAVPEPTSLGLLAIGALGVLGRRRRA